MEPDNAQNTAIATRPPPAETGPFVLRALLEDIPLSAEGDRDNIEINCVEFLGTYLPDLLRFCVGCTDSIVQSRTSTLEPPHQKSYTLYRYPQTPRIPPEDQHIS